MITYLGYGVDPESGLVTGRRGKPIRKVARGYIQAANGRAGTFYMAHRLVWESVNGPIPNDLQINHINGIKTDNRISNLELVTGSENTAHAYRLGLRTAVGEANGRAVLAEGDVLAIRQSRESPRKAANRFGVSSRTIRDIRAYRRWRHLP